MAGPQRGGAWKLDRGGFAEASRGLRRGFRKRSIVSSKTGPETHSALPNVFLSSSNHEVASQSVNVTGLCELASRGFAAHNVSHKWLRGLFGRSPRS